MTKPSARLALFAAAAGLAVAGPARADLMLIPAVLQSLVRRVKHDGRFTWI